MSPGPGGETEGPLSGTATRSERDAAFRAAAEFDRATVRMHAAAARPR